MTTTNRSHHGSSAIEPAARIDEYIVRDTITDRAGALLDELDSFITELSGAMEDATTARQVIADAESEQAIIEASISLDIEGKNETARKALLVLGLGAGRIQAAREPIDRVCPVPRHWAHLLLCFSD